MTDKEKLELTKAEIERRINKLSKSFYTPDTPCGIALQTHKEMLSYINSVSEEPVSEDLEEAIGKYCSNPDNFATWIGGDETDDIRLIIKAIKFGAQWKEQQMMTKAVDVEVKVDAGGYPYIPQIELYDYVEDIPLAKKGDKYKVVLIKED